MSDKQYEDMLVEMEINNTLELRENMLLAHEVMGWTTAVLLNLNTFVSTPELVGEDVHTILGISGGVGYVITGGLALFTPTLHDEPFVLGGELDTNSRLVHKILSFIHMPAMIATTILGFVIEEYEDDDGGSVDWDTYKSLKTAHQVTAIVTATSLTLSLIVIKIDF